MFTIIWQELLNYSPIVILALAVLGYSKIRYPQD